MLHSILKVSISVFTLASTLLFSGCSGHALQDLADETFNDKPVKTEKKQPAPSQNPSLNAVSPSVTAASEGDGDMQKGLDTWTEEEWTPKTEGNRTAQEINEDDNSTFTLQKYVNKTGVYLDEKEKEKAGKPKQPSHVEKMESMPVIGK